MFFDKNKDITDKLKPSGYDPQLIGKAADMVDDQVPDSAILDFLSGSLKETGEPALVLNYIKKRTKKAYLERVFYTIGLGLLLAAFLVPYSFFSERIAWYDFLFLIPVGRLLQLLIRNGVQYLRVKQTGPALEVKIRERQFSVSKDNRLRVDRMLIGNGYTLNGLADEICEGVATGDMIATADKLKTRFSIPVEEGLKLTTLVKKEFREIHAENALGLLVIAVITSILSWFIWRFKALTTGAIITYAFILFMLVLCLLSYAKARRIRVEN